MNDLKILLLRMLGGDRDAAKDLCKRCKQYLLNNPDWHFEGYVEVDDVVSATMVKLCEGKASAVIAADAPWGYLTRMLVHTGIDLLRQKGGKHYPTPIDLDDVVSVVVTDPSVGTTLVQVLQYMAKNLSSLDCEILLLASAGHTGLEIQQIFGFSSREAVYQRLHRARARLRKHFKDALLAQKTTLVQPLVAYERRPTLPIESVEAPKEGKPQVPKEGKPQVPKEGKPQVRRGKRQPRIAAGTGPPVPTVFSSKSRLLAPVPVIVKSTKKADR